MIMDILKPIIGGLIALSTLYFFKWQGLVGFCIGMVWACILILLKNK